MVPSRRPSRPSPLWHGHVTIDRAVHDRGQFVNGAEAARPERAIGAAQRHVFIAVTGSQRSMREERDTAPNIPWNFRSSQGEWCG